MPEIAALRAFADNYIWAITAGNETHAVVVDPGEAAPVLAFLSANELQLEAILITHHHPDHTAGVGELLRRHPVPVYGPAEAERAARVTDVVAEGDTIPLPGLALALTAIAVPGHTAGHIALHGNDILFSGDTLFRGGCGRLFEGDAAQMRASLDKLRALPAATRVYCGHEYTEKNLEFAAAVEPDNDAIRQARERAREDCAAGKPTLPSDIGTERAINPFLRWDQPAVVEAAARRAGRQPADADETFAIIRRWKDGF